MESEQQRVVNKAGTRKAAATAGSAYNTTHIKVRYRFEVSQLTLSGTA